MGSRVTVTKESDVCLYASLTALGMSLESLQICLDGCWYCTIIIEFNICIFNHLLIGLIGCNSNLNNIILLLCQSDGVSKLNV